MSAQDPYWYGRNDQKSLKRHEKEEKRELKLHQKLERQEYGNSAELRRHQKEEQRELKRHQKHEKKRDRWTWRENAGLFLKFRVSRNRNWHL